jgi:DtxR family Mn-dependent transcriptional regulator
LDEETMSESIEMYLLRVALLQREGQPVPVPALAQELSVSPISANEMCRKLAEKGLIDYEPYKGVTLTAQGEWLARQVLRCRRLWEVFLVETLGIAAAEAEAIACRFEHVTPEELAERLAVFLGHPTVSPQNEPIPPGRSAAVERPIRPLTTLTVGEQGQVVNIVTDPVSKDFLRHQGVSPGVIVEILTVTTDGSQLLETSGRRLSLSRAIAGDIDIIPITEANRE